MARSRRRWRKRLGLGFLGLVLLAVFHRPLIFELTRYFIARVAKQQNLEVDYEMAGSIFTTLRVENFRARPTEGGPVQRIDIGLIHLRYNLWGFLWTGPPALLRLVEVRDVLVELAADESLPPEKTEGSRTLRVPAFFPETLRLENINFISRGSGGDTEVRGLSMTLLPDGPGKLHIDVLDIPGLRRWERITGVTTYRDRNLVLTSLVVGPEIAIERLNLDASQLDKDRLGLAIEGAFVGAPFALSLNVLELNTSNRVEMQLSCQSLLFSAVRGYLDIPLPIEGALDDALVTFTGAPANPALWAGAATLQLDHLVVRGVPLGATRLAVELGEGNASLDATAQLKGNEARLHADAQLPQTLEGFARTDATGKLHAALSDLRILSSKHPGELAGNALVNADLQMQEGALAVKANVQSQKLAFDGSVLTDAFLDLQIGKNITAPPDGPIFAGLAATVEGRVGRLDSHGYAVENVRIDVGSDNADVILRNLSFAKGKNSLRISGKHRLPDDLQSFADQPSDISVTVEASELAEFATAEAAASMAGQLNVQGDVSAREGRLSGELSIESRGLMIGGLDIRSIKGQVQIDDNVARVAPFDLLIDDGNRLSLHGQVALDAPHTYEADVDVQLRDLSKLQPLLGRGPKAPKVAGTLTASWKGSGNAKILQQQGFASLTLAGGRFGEFDKLEANLSANYSPQFVNIPDFRIRAPSVGEGSLSAFWANDRLEISNLTVRRNGQRLLEGTMEVPFVLGRISETEQAIPNDEPLKISLRSGTLHLRRLLATPGGTPAFSGTAELGIDASGTLDSLRATVTAEGRRIQSTAASNAAPADIDLAIRLREGRLEIDGSLRQQLIEPLRITGSMPLDPVELKQAGRLDPETPVEIHVQLPQSSLAFASALIPAVRLSRGHASGDVRVDGTIGRPAIHGKLSASMEALRFDDPSLPPVSDIRLRVDFAKDQLRLTQAQARLAGGAVAVAGGVDLADLQRPRLNLRLGARNALVMQNQDLSARVSADIRIRGPLDEAGVTGKIYFTQSRFFRDIEILPIGLPRRPAPTPPAQRTAVSFPDPPLRNWKFDLQIQTQDPFRIQNNLANGRVTADLHLGGTGLNPWLEGNVRIEELVTSLPFSRLNVQSGIISFARDQPLEPILNIHGTSTIRHYDVAVHIRGSARDPQAVFTSNPPLPESDIVSLIATGATTDELGRDPNVLAGRAAILLVRRLSDKFFPRRGPPADDGSFLDRFDFDFGAVDPKTGRQSASVRVPLTENFLLMGGLDVTGNVRGRLGYFIRFR